MLYYCIQFRDTKVYKFPDTKLFVKSVEMKFTLV